MSVEYIIKKAEYPDIDKIYEIELECFPLPWTIDTFRKELNVPYSDILIAANRNQIIGYSVSWMIIDELHLHKIAVTESFKRKGIGTALIDCLVDKYSYTLKKILLEVREKNVRARQFYARLGFAENGIRYNYYPDDNAVLIEKNIV